VIILINGPINAGKSTVGRLLAALLPRTAHVEVDALRAFIPSVPLDEAIPINLENTVAVAGILVKRGFGVVITYPLGCGDHAYLVGHLIGLGTTIHTFTLAPSLAVALGDRGDRPLSDHERTRIRRQYADGRHEPPFGTRIDNSRQTPRETADIIVDFLRTIAPEDG